MMIRLNGKDVDCSGTVADILRSYRIRPDSVVVERNGAIVHRQDYAAEKIGEGDVIEIVRMVGGG